MSAPESNSRSDPAPAGSPPADPARYEAFLMHFGRFQLQILGFVRSLVHDRTAADDVFQQTSLTIWRCFDSFREGEPFLPWALGIARKEVLHYWRSRRRDRLVFSEAALGHLADAAAALADEVSPRQAALESCVDRLPDRQRRLVDMFYGRRLSADEIAAAWGLTVHAVYKALKIMRRGLLECVERRLAAEA
jgi:RNA polymerase sigma-70 factor (ECF subfamily)